MDIQPIRTEADHETALAEIERLFDVAPYTSESDRLDLLATLVESYEKQHYPIPAPDPAVAAAYYRECRITGQPSPMVPDHISAGGGAL